MTTSGIRPLLFVLCHRECYEHRDVNGVDDDREGEHDEWSAAHSVAQECELDQSRRYRICQECPPADGEEFLPREILHATERDEIYRQQQGGRTEKNPRRREGHLLWQVRGEIDAADEDQCERRHRELSDWRKGALAH